MVGILLPSLLNGLLSFKSSKAGTSDVLHVSLIRLPALSQLAISALSSSSTWSQT